MRPIIGTAVTCLSITAFSQAVDAQVSSNSEVTLQEVVVTAQKREERLQDVPISIAVLSGDALDSSSDRGVVEAVSRVPGVFAGVSNQGGRQGGNPMITIRGVSSPSTGTSTTGYYLDSIPYSRSGQANVPDTNPYDLDRVEVLRGPQGTLYGASALNGVVRVLTKNPNLHDFEFKARGSLSGTNGGSESYAGDAAFNMPLIQDKLAARLVVGHQYLGGWIDKPNRSERDVNDTEKTNARVKLAAQPTENFSIGLAAWFSRSDSGAPPSSADGGRTNTSPLDESNSVDLDIYSLDLGYDTRFFSIKSATSYMEQSNTNAFDFSFFSPPGTYTAQTAYGDSSIFSEELVLSSTGDGPWRWTLGSLYRDSQENATGTSVNNGIPAIPGITHNESKSIAAYGELTRIFADGQFEVTGGLRYFRDKVRDWEDSRANVGIPPTGLKSVETTFKKTTPRVVLTWHPSKDATLYASYAKGFRSGINQAFAVTETIPTLPASAPPDTLTNYEIGGKASFGRFSFDMAAYYIDWQDPQSNNTLYIGTPPRPFPILVSGDSASGPGIDLALVYSPVDPLTLGLNVGWNDLTFDTDVRAVQPVGPSVLVHPKGSRRLSSPSTTGGIFIDYSAPLGGSGYRGRTAASANYISEQIASISNSTGTPFMGDSMTIVRYSFTLEAPKHWSAMLFVDNMTNAKGLLRDSFWSQYNTVIRPRTAGIQFEYKY